MVFGSNGAGVLPDYAGRAGSMGSFSGYPPSMFGATLAVLHVLMQIYNCCTISRCIIDMTGGVLEEEGRMLSMATRGDLANEGSKV